MSDGQIDNSGLPRIWSCTGKLIANPAVSTEERLAATRMSLEREAKKLPIKEALKLFSNEKFKGLFPEQPTRSDFDRLRALGAESSGASEFIDELEFASARGVSAEKLVAEALPRFFEARLNQAAQGIVENRTGKHGTDTKSLEGHMAEVKAAIHFEDLAHDVISTDTAQAKPRAQSEISETELGPQLPGSAQPA